MDSCSNKTYLLAAPALPLNMMTSGMHLKLHVLLHGRRYVLSVISATLLKSNVVQAPAALIGGWSVLHDSATQQATVPVVW
jgi:hypothetical protein